MKIGLHLLTEFKRIKKLPFVAGHKGFFYKPINPNICDPFKNQIDINYAYLIEFRGAH